MNMNAIAMYLEVCKTLSISRAAKNLYVTQPAVSQALSQLEDHLGVSLLNRTSRQISLTREGEMFYYKAADLHKVYLETQSLFETTEASSLVIGCSVTTATHILPELLASYPNDIQVHVENARGLRSKLASGELDFAFIEGNVPLEGFISYPVYNFEAVFVASPLYLKENTKPFSDQKFLLRENGSSYRSYFDSIAALHHVHIDPYWESVSTESLIQVASHGLGIALAPRFACQDLIDRGILGIYEVNSPTQHDKNALFVNKHRIHESEVQAFIKHVFDDKK